MLDVLVILDRSGSMQLAKNDHEGGLRSFVEDQKANGDDARFTLVQFDDHDPCEVVYDRVALDAVDKLELIPRGSTPLLDAIGKSVAHLRTKSNVADVVCMVITDGQENASREWTKSRVKDLITECEKTGWTFMFLGANMDAFDEAGGLGITRGATMNFNDRQGQTVNAAYMAASANFVGYRNIVRAGSKGGQVTNSVRASARSALNFTDAQRDAAVTPQTGDADPNKGEDSTTNGPVSRSGDSQSDSKTEA